MNEGDKNIEQRMREALAPIRTVLNKDGGDVEFVRFVREDGHLYIRFLGSCSTCPLNIMTLQAGVQAMLTLEFPEIERVMMVHDTAAVT
ncbi:MAG: NifU family protein [Bacteroidota bacterium]|nr:NifU family protein [Bacteroidota bacterium]